MSDNQSKIHKTLANCKPAKPKVNNALATNKQDPSKVSGNQAKHEQYTSQMYARQAKSKQYPNNNYRRHKLLMATEANVSNTLATFTPANPKVNKALATSKQDQR